MMLKKSFGGKSFLLAAGLLALGLPWAAEAASEGEVVLRMLLKKGVITQAEYDEVMGELSQAQAAAPASAPASAPPSAAAGEATSAGALPDWVKNLSIGGGLTGVVQGTLNNDDLDTNHGDDVIDGTYSADLEITVPVMEHGEAFIALEAGEGVGLPGDEVNNFLGTNADALGDDGKLSILEAWYEHRFLEDRLVFTLGKVDLSNYFDGNAVANDETSQFLADGFVNNAAVEFPDNGPGARLTYSPNELVDLSVGWQEGDGNNWDGEDLFHDAFLIAEVDLKPKWGGLDGNYRFYAWNNRSDHADWNDAPEHDADANWGVGVSFDQALSDSITAFLRAGYQDEEVASFDVAWSAGLSLSGGLWNRKEDNVAFAYGMAHLSDDFENTDPFAHTSDEGLFEAYYRYVVNDHLAFSPHFQVVHDAGGDEDADTVYIGGLRGQISF